MRATGGLAAYAPRLLAEWPPVDGPDHRAIDGTLVFADVSGFTALSERLARKGKIGAEEMVEILNQIFGELLRVAASWGGEMLKFGGDALLLFFTGDGHERSAASAAHWMQRTLRREGRVDTGSGRVRLRMSVGMNSGTFDVFRVGGSHLELVIMGPATTETVAMESAADATEILVSPSTAAALPDRCLGSPKAGGRLLVQAPRRKPPLEELPDAPAVEGLDLVAPCMRPHLSEGRGEPEHRQVTNTFLHIKGVDELLQSEGPALVADRLDRAVRHVQGCLERHQVAFLATDVAGDGTKVMAAAGAPFTTGNDEERALRAVHEIISTDVGLPIRAGVNRGRVFAGDVGPQFRRTYTTIGDPTNTAARVMAKAGPGELLALAPVLDRSLTLFETEQLEPFAAKGKSEPLVPYRVGQLLGRRSSARRDLPLLGRDAELAALEGLFADVRGGARRVVEVVGQAGMGTSRLVADALGRSEGLSAVVARCTPYDAIAAYSGIGRLLTALVGKRSAGALTRAVEERAPDLEPWVPLLALLLDVEVAPTDAVADLDPSAIATKAAEVVDQLIEVSFPGPVALVLEDAHWCDPASRAVLGAMATLPSPGLVCLTRQPGDPVVAAGERIEVGPLADDAARSLVRLLTPTPLLPQQIDSVVERSGGNPLFLSELVGNAVLSGELPETVEAFFAARIDRLDLDERAALRYAAVAGSRFDLLLVEKLLAQAGRSPSVDWPGLSDFVEVNDDKGTFISVLARDAAYEALPYRQRRTLHQEVGDILADLGAGPEELAGHYHSAGDADRTWRHARTAAARAERRHAYELAATFHGWAVEAGRKHAAVPTDRVAIQLRSQAEAVRRAGRLGTALELYGTARRLIGADHPLVPQLCVDRGSLLTLLGQQKRAARWYRSARTSPQAAGDGALHSRILLGEANIAAAAHEFVDAHSLAMEAAQAGAAAGDTQTQLGALALAHVVANRLQLDDRADLGAQALALAEEEADLRQQATILGNLGVDAHLSGEPAKALDYYERTRTVAARSGQVIAHAVAANNIGEVHLESGATAEAIAAFEEAEMTAAAAGHWYAHVSRANRGRALAASGGGAEGIAMVQSALAELEALRSPAAAEVERWLEQLGEPPQPA